MLGRTGNEVGQVVINEIYVNRSPRLASRRARSTVAKHGQVTDVLCTAGKSAYAWRDEQEQVRRPWVATNSRSEWCLYFSHTKLTEKQGSKFHTSESRDSTRLAARV